MIEFPEDFSADPALLAALETPSPTSIRFNPFKISEKPEGENIPWSRYGYYLAERPQFTLDPLFHGGAYYVQEASSMFLEQVFTQFTGDSPLKVLDLCAAPGGKTTHISSLIGLESLLVSNEVIRSRANVLVENVKKWGLGNVVVTNNDPSHFAPLKGFFDVVVIDAPCSGEGMFRKAPEARGEWSLDNVKLCAARGQRIVSDAWDCLRTGGLLIYSTCTFNQKENEDNISWIEDNFYCERVELDIPSEWGIESGVGTYRFYPHKLKGEGFFAAVLRKSDGRGVNLRSRGGKVADLPKKEIPIVAPWCIGSEFMRFYTAGQGRIFGYYEGVSRSIDLLTDHLTVIYSGVEMGQIMGGKLKPEHSLALFHDISEAVPFANLELIDALKFLRRENINSELFEEGINIVSYQGLPIGFVKRIGARCNNMLPTAARIRM